MKLKTCVESSAEGGFVAWAVGGLKNCQDEKRRIKAYRKMTAELAAGKASMPCTATLVALHNMVTVSVPKEYMNDARHNYYCPQDVVIGLKKSDVFSSDPEVQKFTLPSFGNVEGVPGLDAKNSLIECPSK